MLVIPKNYRNILGGVEQTEKAIKAVKDMFQVNLSAQLALLRVTAPMMVLSGQGLNDDLNGVERPVRFPVKSMNEAPAEVVHSLAKWKRLKLAELHTAPGFIIRIDNQSIAKKTTGILHVSNEIVFRGASARRVEQRLVAVGGIQRKRLVLDLRELVLRLHLVNEQVGAH